VAEVKFTPVIKQWFLNVGLHNVSMLGSIEVSLIVDDCLDFLKGFADTDALSPVGELPGFHNPHIFLCPSGLCLFPALLIKPKESEVVFVLEAFLDMKGVGQVIEHQILELLVVDGHGSEQGLLVPNDIIVD
jgi:hypothetical protein